MFITYMNVIIVQDKRRRIISVNISTLQGHNYVTLLSPPLVVHKVPLIIQLTNAVCFCHRVYYCDRSLRTHTHIIYNIHILTYITSSTSASRVLFLVRQYGSQNFHKHMFVTSHATRSCPVLLR